MTGWWGWPFLGTWRESSWCTFPGPSQGSVLIQLLPALRAASSDFPLFSCSQKGQSQTGLISRRGVHFRVGGTLSHLLLCGFYPRIPAWFCPSFSHFAGRNLIQPCPVFPPKERSPSVQPSESKSLPLGRVPRLPVTGGLLIFLAPCQFCQ